MFPVLVNEMVVRVNHEIRESQIKLETEDSSTELANLQGKVAGSKKFLDFLAAEFHLTQGTTEDLGDKPVDLRNMTEQKVAQLAADVKLIQQTDEWLRVVSRIEERKESLKEFLLFRAEKGRDLTVAQATWRAMTFYMDLFEKIRIEDDRREIERKEKRENPELFGGQEDEE